MRQREAKMGVDGAATPWKEHQRSAAGRWLDAEAAALAFPQRAKRLRCWTAKVVLVAFFMAVPPMVFLLGARTSVPPVWISALRRRGRLLLYLCSFRVRTRKDLKATN
jgi:xyloglucan fucosyltransferase